MNRPCWLIIVLITAAAHAQTAAIPPIERRVPPRPTFQPGAEQMAAMAKGLASLESRLKAAPSRELLPDAQVFAKAARFALEHREFYNKQDPDKVQWALDQAAERLDQLAAGKTPWVGGRGTMVRGFRSAIDDSIQPYGLTVPQNLDLRRPAPLYIWLHGRGDTTTDLHFLHRLGTRGASAPMKDMADAVILEPFGRQCIGWKSSGEIDVFEAIEHVKRHYRIDEDRIVLAGYSMGGAGAWHIGAHYTDRFCAVQAGAGFVDLARYQNITPDHYPAWYERTLWSVYDVPEYVMNLFNVPVIAYNGEIDRQRASGEIMAGLFRESGRELPHILGPGLEHKAPGGDSLKQVMALLEPAVQRGRDRFPEHVLLQTRTLRYGRMHWVEALTLQEHWKNTIVEARRTGPRSIDLTTTNVGLVRLTPPDANLKRFGQGYEITIDGVTATVAAPSDALVIDAASKKIVGASDAPADAKRHGLQGPIDDVLLAPFLVVRPTGRSKHAAVQQWVDFELDHFASRWRALYRGELRIRNDAQVTDQDIQRYHLILFGDAESNQLIRRVLDDLPLHWSSTRVEIAGKSHDAAHHVPLLIQPNPLNPGRYVVLNSGPTHREAHDRTNSLQNPKLPDWAVIDVRTPPDAEAPGKVVDADFFDENWQVKAR